MHVSIRLSAMVLALGVMPLAKAAGQSLAVAMDRAARETPGVVAGTWRQEVAGVVEPLPDPQLAPGLDNLKVSGPPATRRPGSLTPVTSGAARAD